MFNPLAAITDSTKPRAAIDWLILLYYQHRGLCEQSLPPSFLLQLLALRQSIAVRRDESEVTLGSDENTASVQLPLPYGSCTEEEWTCLRGALETCKALLRKLPIVCSIRVCLLEGAIVFGSRPCSNGLVDQMTEDLRRIADMLESPSPDFDTVIAIANGVHVDFIVLTYLDPSQDYWVLNGELANLREVLQLAQENPHGMRPY